MKLQKITAYRYGDKIHYKYIITIPEEAITELGWKEGSELEHSVKDGSILIKFVSLPMRKKSSILEPKMTYEEFRDKIKQALEYNDNGMTWTELKAHLKLEQVVPNNKWVRQMEKDIGLIRIKDVRGIVWKIHHV